jgi:hypothetical protein
VGGERGGASGKKEQARGKSSGRRSKLRGELEGKKEQVEKMLACSFFLWFCED